MKHTAMLPFLDDDDLNELAHKILNGEIKNVKLVTLYPFVDSKTLNEIVDKLIEQNKGRHLVTALPFLSKEKVDELHETIKENPIDGFDEEILMPFLGKAKIKDMFYSFLKKEKKNSSDSEE